jgi:hypothetical protein
MAPRSWYWAYFVRGKKKYQKNGSNFEAYCVGCVAFYTDKLTKADQQAVADGAHLGTLRTKGEIYKEGKRCFLTVNVCCLSAETYQHVNWQNPCVGAR